eukprot:TRINITY_DN40468_c0_g1_i1.p2 TRINITY_DN40468_c0_g1~~TRINITY_DN40468_c0_g1_i1.p2  ORF type:complete len:103 (-),score=18.79 TRINITY_DN40468_c0_g1_i1:144-452(-)
MSVLIGTVEAAMRRATNTRRHRTQKGHSLRLPTAPPHRAQRTAAPLARAPSPCRSRRRHRCRRRARVVARRRAASARTAAEQRSALTETRRQTPSQHAAPDA